MSEQQHVHFLALDQPLDDVQLAFMRKQSSRARVSRWEFSNEYHYGDFRGNAVEMLRRGYDVHLHYANFGIRKFMVRLPAGLPCDRKTFKRFAVADSVVWIPDNTGAGGILSIEPDADAGTFSYPDFEVDKLIHELTPIRTALLTGDLRALYIAWLACELNDEAEEPPIPAGLNNLTSDLDALANFYDVPDELIVAAAERSPPLPETRDELAIIGAWVDKQSHGQLSEWLRQCLVGNAAPVRADLLAKIRIAAGAAAWPLADSTRTLAALRASAEVISQSRLAAENQAREAARRKRLASLAADPKAAVKTVEAHVQERSASSYAKAVQTLVELREALGPDKGPAATKAVAEKLRDAYPSRRGLLAELKEHGFLVRKRSAARSDESES